MRSIRTCLFCCVLFAATHPAAVAADGPAKDVPELEVLKHYAGTWDVTLAEGNTKGEATARWILNGRFLQQSATVRPDDGSEKLEMETIITFDTNSKVYRSWTFLSNGNRSEAEGKWDERTKTMTSVSRGSDNHTSTTTANFSEPGVEKWKIVIKDPSGQTVEISGVNKLRKP